LYTEFSVIASAGLDGIEQGLEAPAPINEDIFHMTEEERAFLGIDNLPGSLAESIKALESGEIAAKTLGEHVYSEYVSMKKVEWDSYRTAVHAWEIDNYHTKF
jgi:glutamine synthetase